MCEIFKDNSKITNAWNMLAFRTNVNFIKIFTNVVTVFKIIFTNVFQTWYKIFPSFVKYESEYKRLTLYAHVYFIIRTVNLSSECIDFKNLRSVRDFKRFLSQNELAYSDVEFTKYFMLPHQEEPRKDPLFSALFDVNFKNFVFYNFFLLYY